MPYSLPEAPKQDENKYCDKSNVTYSKTSFVPWKFIRDMGSSSQCALIMAPVQEANDDNLGIFRSSRQ